MKVRNCVSMVSAVAILSAVASRAHADDSGPSSAGVSTAPATESSSPTHGFEAGLLGEGYPSTGKRVFAWSGVVVSGALLASGLVVHLAAFGKKGSLDDLKAPYGSVDAMCGASADKCAEYTKTKHDLRSLGTTYLVLYDAGFIALGATLLTTRLFWSNATSPSGAAARPRVIPVVGLGQVGVEGAF